MLTGASASKVFPGQEYLPILIPWIVQYKIFPGVSLRVKAPIIEQVLAVSGPRGEFEELLRHDLVRVYVYSVKRNGLALQNSKGLQLDPLPDVHKFTFNGCSSRHHRADKVCSPTGSLASLEITVGSAGTALARRQNVWVHTEAHAAS